MTTTESLLLVLVTVATVVHFAFMYGTDRRTAPISMWGSVYHNFAVVGIVVLHLLLAFIFQKLTMWILQRPSRNIIELLGISSFSVVLGNWVVGGSEYLLNAGLGASLCVWWVGTRVSRRNDIVVLTREPWPPRTTEHNDSRSLRGDGVQWR